MYIVNAPFYRNIIKDRGLPKCSVYVFTFSNMCKAVIFSVTSHSVRHRTTVSAFQDNIKVIMMTNKM